MYYVGIDFGTTNSSIAVIDNETGEVRVIELEGDTLLGGNCFAQCYTLIQMVQLKQKKRALTTIHCEESFR